MKPHNDFTNPYIWGIMVLSLIPAIIVFLLLGIGSNSLMQTQIKTIITITPIPIAYYFLWNWYKKSEDYKRRYS